ARLPGGGRAAAARPRVERVPARQRRARLRARRRRRRAGGAMKLGIVLPLIEVADITRLAVAVEDRGFESLFIGEHTHMPTSTVHAYTKGKPAEGRSDGFVPDYYRRFPDPYIVLAAAAA